MKVQPLNALAWLRKLGYGSTGLRFRDELIDFETLEGLESANCEERPEQRKPLLNGVAVPKERAERRPGSPARPWGHSGRIPVGSIRQPVPASRADETRQRERSAPFVGRAAELRVLLRAWRTAAGGRGRVALVSGETGIGKSRIVRELCERQAAYPHTVLWHRCSPEYAASPLHPLVSRLQQSAGFLREDGAKERLAKLEALLNPALTGIEDPREGAVLLAKLLGVDAPEEHSQLRLMPRRLRARIFEVLLALVAGLSRRQMVVAVYEDLQWADQSTLEFLDRLNDCIARMPVLAVLTSRPEFKAAWNGRAGAVPLALPPLERASCRAMIEHLCDREALAEPVIDDLIGRSGGVPLLVEELTSAVLEAAEGTDARPMADGRSPAVPRGLTEAVTARLGRSSTVAAVARVGAVIGREFAYEMLTALADWPEDRLRWALDRLVRSGLVVCHGAPPNASYAFKHVLVREAAYGSLAEPVRRSLHRAVAQVLEECWPDVAASTPELMARHYSAAGASERAAAWWLRAGKGAAECCAHAEAIELFSKGLELLDSFPGSTERAAYRAALLAALARSLTATRGAEAPEVAQACSLARVLCQGVDLHPQYLPAMRTLWDHYNTRAEFGAAGELAGQCHRLAAGAQDAWWTTEADFCRGVSCLFMGQLPEAREHLTRSIVRIEAQCQRHLALTQVANPRIVSLAHLAQALWLCGYPDQAARASQEAIASARAAGHPFLLIYALLAASWVCELRREGGAAGALAAEALALAAEEDLPAFRAMATILRVAAAIDLEPSESTAAAAMIDKALDAYRAAGAEIARPYLLGLRAGVHETAAEIEQALGVLAEAAEVASSTGERWYEPEIRRREGELLLRQSITNRRVASARFCQAIAVANQVGGKSLELRAAVSLARLWADLGRRAQARDLLLPVYGWFKEGFDTADLVTAKALLKDLS